MRARTALGPLLLLTALAACHSVPNKAARLEPSSYGCMAAVLNQKLPPNLPDKQAHCQASGLIARYCSPTEAYMAGIGKELRDALGFGDVEWADWKADRVGVGCAYRSQSDEALASCCKANERGASKAER
jgi:hypothetical protein